MKAIKIISIAITSLALLGSMLFANTATKSQESLIWFEVNPDGSLANPHGMPGINPYGCSGTGLLCSRALTFIEGNPSSSEVLYDEVNDVYTIKPGVNIQTDYDDEIEKSP